jgi:hypothetical protein
MPKSSTNNWQSIIDLVSELKRCDENGITMASIAMAFICIDSLANLGRPIDKEKVTRSDFKLWVDEHLHAHPDQQYQYRGKDVYAARCAFLHTYGSESELHNEDADTVRFAYHDGGNHNYNPSICPGLALIGAKSFVNDVVHAIESFLNKCKGDELLMARVESRISGVLQITPYPN